MSLNHNQMAYAAIISTLIFGSLFVGISGFYQTSSGVGDFDSAAEENITPDLEISSSLVSMMDTHLKMVLILGVKLKPLLLVISTLTTGDGRVFLSTL